MSSVILRHTRDADGSRYLAARREANGDIVIVGQDLGRGVESVFGGGCSEYEWAWTIRAAAVPKLAEALGGVTDVLAAMRDKFSGDNGAKLEAFLKDHSIAVEFWSRIGD